MNRTKSSATSRNIIGSLTCLFIISLLLAGCKKDPEKPQLILLDDSLVFHGDETLKLRLTTNGDELCRYGIAELPRWITTNSFYYYGDFKYILPGDTVSVEFTSHIGQGEQGPLQDQIILDSGNGFAAVSVTGWPSAFTHYLVTDTLYYPTGIDQQHLTIENLGNTTLNFSITSSTGHIMPALTQGEMAAGTQNEIEVSIDRNALQLENCLTELYVDINGQISRVVICVEKKQLIPSNIVAAAYSKATDALVYASTDLSLTVYHPESRTSQSMTLPFVPTCLTLSTDGTHALVGHDGHVSYIDLTTLSVVCCPSITCNAFSVVLGPNEWAYVVPKRDQWVRIRNIDLNHPDNPEIMSAHNIYAGANAILSPSGKAFYCAINGLSSDEINKYDIQNDTAVYVSDVYYSNPVGGKLWLSDGENRIITRLRSVYSTSDINNQDLNYQGRIIFDPNLNSQPSIVWIDHNNLTRRFFIIFSANNYWDETNRPFVCINDSDNFAPLYSIPLETFISFNESGHIVRHTPNPKFVFVNSEGNEIYVLTQALDGQQNPQWGLETLFIE